MKTKMRIHPESLAIIITRFRNWIEIGFIIHIYSDGSFEGELLQVEK